MPAKFLHVFSDEHAEIQKQIGCMTGILQIFDRQHVLTAKRINGYNHKRNHHPSGNALTTSTSLRVEHGESSPRTVFEKTLSKSSNENQRMSMESSRTSFSSSSCSSFSSLDYSKSTQQEAALPFEQTIFTENPSKNSSKLKTSNGDGRPPRSEPRDDLPTLSVQTNRRSLDFRDVVKDSINRDSRGLSVKTSSRVEEKINSLKHRDSPRPMQISKSTNVKLKEAPWNFSDETPRSSFEVTKGGSFYSESRGAHRFSFDGKEIQRQSPDLPRLSLDSREGSYKNSNFDSKLNSIMKDLDKSNRKQRISQVSKIEQEEELVTHRRSTSVVVKLMGLEAMPSLSAGDHDTFDEQKTRLLRTSQGSPQKFIEDCDLIIKPVQNSKVSIETAPWRHQKAKLTHREAQLKQQQDSVYSEIEKRLKELEFRQSSKDLRALKQILDAMQAKGLLERKNSEDTATQNQKISPMAKTRTFESPIVIMKPAKSVKIPGGTAASVVPLEGIPGIRKLRIDDKIGERKPFTKNRVTKGQFFYASVKELSDEKNNNRIEDNGAQNARPRTAQNLSSGAQQSPRKDSGSLLKSSGSLSPRLQQKRLETERSRPPLPSSESSKTQRSSVNRKQVESVSPRNKLRKKPNSVQGNDEQASESSEVKNSDYQCAEISLRTESNISADLSADTYSTFSQKSSKSPSGRDARRTASIIKQKKDSISLNGGVSMMKIVATASEQPSPISVLDAAFYQDGLLSPPSEKRFCHSTDEKNQISDDSGTPSSSLDSPTQNPSSEINHKKLQSIENLLQKLRALSPTDDDGPSTTDHIASLSETNNPDDRYVSELLLASGLLLKDLTTNPMPIQLHASGHPINPDLFFVLEQTKMRSLSSMESKTDQEKLHRKLVFDAVNELIVQKLNPPHSEYFLRTRNLASRFPSGQKLLKELCLEIEKLKNESSNDESKISHEEVHRQSWGQFSEQVPGIVLEIERLMFKDLIDEVVSGEAESAARRNASRRRRQLFSKQAL